MKSIVLGITLLVSAVAQEASAQRRAIPERLDLGKYAVVTRGHHVVPKGKTISGGVLVLRGNLDVYGDVAGAATALGGDVIVHKGGSVRGGAVAMMGRVRNEGGSILGIVKDLGPTHNRVTVSFGGSPRTTGASLASAFLWLVVLLLAGTFVLFFAGDHLRRTVEVVSNEMGRSLFTGVLGGLAVVPALIALVIAMAITIIGIFIIPVGVTAFLIALSGIAVLGFLAVAQVAGIAIAGETGSETKAGAELQYLFSGVLAFLSLWIVAAAFTWFPIVGALLRVLAVSVTFVAVTTGFGAVILSFWRGRRRKNAVAV